MPFDIETYLNSLPNDTTEIDVSKKGLTYLPNLSRFKNLKKLNCPSNQLTSLPPLNEKLLALNCNNNELSSLPPLNKNLEVLFCYNNELSSLPPLNENLRILFCNNNELTSLPHLNDKLKHLICDNNLLTSLPKLNENLLYLFCYKNQLTSLPKLNEKLEYLRCDNNQLTSFPPLNDRLRYLHWDKNSIYNLLISIINLDGKLNLKNDYLNNDFKKLNKILKIINKFRNMYYQLKFKKHFIKWLWKSKEKQIAERYHPKYLLENLDDNTDLDEFLNNW